MSKQRRKLHCICKGKANRVVPGTDHQKHVPQCPIVKNR